MAAAWSARPPRRGARRRRHGAGRIARPAGVGEIERLPCPAAAGSADRDPRQESAAGRRRAPAVRPGHWDSGWGRRHRHGAGLAPAARPAGAPGRSAPAPQSAGPARLDLGLPERWRSRLRRGCRGDIGLGCGGRSAGGCLRTTLQRPQPLLELPVAVLQLLVLAGELAQPVLQLLDSQLRIGIIGLLRPGGDGGKTARASRQSPRRG